MLSAIVIRPVFNPELLLTVSFTDCCEKAVTWSDIAIIKKADLGENCDNAIKYLMCVFPDRIFRNLEY